MKNDITTKFAYVFYEYDKRLSASENLILNAFSHLYNTSENLKERLSILENEISTIKKENENLRILLNEIKPKKKRTLFYKICKPFKYKKLLKEKLELEKQIAIRNEQIREEKRKLEEKRKAEEERRKKQEQSEKLKKRKQEISKLMSTTKKKNGPK